MCFHTMAYASPITMVYKWIIIWIYLLYPVTSNACSKSRSLRVNHHAHPSNSLVSGNMNIYFIPSIHTMGFSIFGTIFQNINTLILGIWCSTIPHLPGCFCPWTFFQNIGFNMVPSVPCMSHLATQLGYSAGEFQTLQLILLATFGVVD